MRVLHFAKYSFELPGGMERHVEALTRGLAAAGVDVTVLAYDPTGAARPRVVDGVSLEPVRPLFHLGSQAVAPGMVGRARLLSHPRPFDVVHEHWPDPLAHVMASLVPGHPVRVMSWHSDIVRQKWLGPLFVKAAHLLPRPDAVVGATHLHLQTEQVARFASPERRHVIPYGIDPEPLSPTPQIMARAAALRAEHQGRPIVFALGRHVYYKGFEVLIRAMQQVRGVLLLGGDGPLQPELRALAARQTKTQVVFLGAIPDAELPAYFHACDVYCLPSIAPAEAFGIVQAEAMLCGKPVVNTSLGNGVNQLAPDGLTALTVPPNDVNALAAALNRVLEEPALAQRLGAAGSARVREHFTAEVMVRKTLDLYTHLVAARGQPAG